MATRTGRMVASGIGAMLLALVSGWVGFEAGRREVEVPSPADPGRGAPGSPTHVERPTDSPSGESPSASVAPRIPGGPVAGTAEAPGESGADAEYPVLEVEVVDAGGAAYPLASVYVLAEGAAGVDDAAHVPHAETDEHGRCRIQVPTPGRYDVGAVSGFAQVLAPSTEVPAGQPLRLAFPPMDEVRFDEGGERLANPIEVTTTPSSRPACFPGRNQRLSAGVTAVRGSDGALAVRAPAGLELEGYVQNSGSLLLKPPRFSAPTSVSVFRGQGIRARLQFAPPERKWTVPVAIDVHFDWGEDARTPGSGTDYTFDLPPETPLAEHPERHVTPCAVVAARRGLLRWSGPDIRPGEAAWDLDQGDVVPVKIEVQEDSPGLTQRATVRVADPERLANEETTLWQVGSSPGRPEGIDDRPVPVGTSTDLGRGTRWVLATCGDSAVAGPRGVDPRSPETPLTLRKGGWLLVVPERVSSGVRPRVRRSDGAPLLRIDVEGAFYPASEAALHAGQRLGPFEPGDLALVVETADGRSAEVRVRIQPGRFTPLSVASCPAK